MCVWKGQREGWLYSKPIAIEIMDKRLRSEHNAYGSTNCIRSWGYNLSPPRRKPLRAPLCSNHRQSYAFQAGKSFFPWHNFSLLLYIFQFQGDIFYSKLLNTCYKVCNAYYKVYNTYSKVLNKNFQGANKNFQALRKICLRRAQKI